MCGLWNQALVPLKLATLECASFAKTHLLTWEAVGVDVIVALLPVGFVFIVPPSISSSDDAASAGTASAGTTTSLPCIVQYACALPSSVHGTVVDGRIVEDAVTGAAAVTRLLISDIITCAVL